MNPHRIEVRRKPRPLVDSNHDHTGRHAMTRQDPVLTTAYRGLERWVPLRPSRGFHGTHHVCILLLYSERLPGGSGFHSCAHYQMRSQGRNVMSGGCRFGLPWIPRHPPHPTEVGVCTSDSVLVTDRLLACRIPDRTFRSQGGGSNLLLTQWRDLIAVSTRGVDSFAPQLRTTLLDT